ncbi:MAG: MFS transporter [Halioglobus sp.]
MHTSTDSVVDHSRISIRQITIILTCVLFNMVDGFDITAMAIAASSIGSELDLNPESLGLLFSFALAGMMCGAMFLAPLADIVGRRILIISSLLLVGVTVCLTAFSSNLTSLVLLRFSSGLGAGALMACQAALASEYAPEKYRALAVAVVTAGYPLGAMSTGLVAHSVIPEFGWRGLFFGGGIAALLMVVIAILSTPESLQFLLQKQPRNALRKINMILKSLERKTLASIPPRPVQHHNPTMGNNVKSLLNSRYKEKTLILWLVFFFCFSTLYFLMSWIPKLMTLSGFSEGVAYSAYTYFNLGGVLGILSMGVIASRVHLTHLVSTYLVLSALLMLVFSQLPPNEFSLTLIIFVIGIAQQGGFTGLYAIATKLYPVELRGTGVGWAIGLGRFGAVIGPAAAGYSIAIGISASGNFVMFSIPMILGGILALKLGVR